VRGADIIVEKAETVVNFGAGTYAWPSCLRIDTHGPGRPMAGCGVALIGAHRIIRQARKIIVGLVVVTHVLEAEMPELAFVVTALGGAEFAGVAAAAMFAQLHGGRLDFLSPPAHPDTIEIGRVQIHDVPNMRVPR
jgi:hypothetical protein